MAMSKLNSRMDGSHMPQTLALAGAGALGVAVVLAFTRRISRTNDGKAQQDSRASARVSRVLRLVGGGLAITASTATYVFTQHRGITDYMLSLGWKGQVGLFVCVAAPLIVTVAYPPKRRTIKLAGAVTFQVMQGVMLSALGYAGPAILQSAAVITGATMLSLTGLAMVAPPKLYMSLAAPLSTALSAVCVANLLSAVTLNPGFAAALFDIYTIGGLTVTAGYVLFDVQKLVDEALLLPDEEFDEIVTALNITMDAINMFVYIADIMTARKRKQRESDDE